MLAFASEPLLAGDIARELAEVSRGRWVLGRTSGYEREELPWDEVMDYMDRLHKDTRRTWRGSATCDDEQPA